MTQTISRMYASLADAKKAAAELKDNLYQDVYVVGREADPAAPPASHDSIVSELMKGHVLKAAAQIYAKGISRGGALVTVHAPFGTAKQAMEIMDSHNPIDSGVADPTEPPYSWDDATPISSLFQMPLLTKTQLPFESFWNVSSLTSKASPFSSMLGMPLLTSGPGLMSGSMGMPLLSKSATPFSSMLRMPTLTKKQ
jgi:hypothetical protein